MPSIGQGLLLAGQSIGQGLQERAEREALLQMLGGTEGATPTPAMLDPRLIAPGSRAGELAAPATPGLLPNLTPDLARGIVGSGMGRELLAAALENLGGADPVAVREGGTLVDPQSGREIYKAPGAVEPPKMRDLLQGNERVFQQFNPATGQWVEVGRGPAFAPAAETNIINAPSGYRVSPEGNLEPIPGGPATEVTGGTAAAVSLGRPAIADAPALEQALFNSDGSLNRMAVASMNTPGVGAIPGTAGVDLRARLLGGIEAILRPISGATITDEEVARRYDMYVPSIFDTEEVARAKLQRYQRDLQSALATATEGRSLAGRPATAVPAVGPGPVDQMLRQGAAGLGREAQLPGLPSLEQLNAWTAEQAEAFIDGLSDEQMRLIPPGIRDQFISKLRGRP